MSRNRFQLLLRFWHFADSNSDDNSRLKSLKALLSLLERNFHTAISPEERLVIGESMISK
jgi:hypothetical protein